MTIIETLIKLRDDIKTWVTNNLVALNTKVDSIQSFSGDYNDLTNQPNVLDDSSDSLNVTDSSGNVILSVDAGGLTTTNVSADTITLGGNDLSSSISSEISAAVNSQSHFSGDYNDLTNRPDILEDGSDSFIIADSSGNVILDVDEDGVKTTAVSINGSDVAGLISTVENAVSTHTNDSTVHITSTERTQWNAKSDFSGDYNDLTNAPNISEDDSGNLVIADPDGNIIFRSDGSGFETVSLTATTLVVDGTDIGATVEEHETLINNKVDKVSGKGLSTNDYTTEEKDKLAGIETGANAYTHPAYTARTGVPTANATPAFGGTFNVSQPVSDSTGHITAVNSRTITIPNTTATTSAAGLMSADDKSKLDEIVAGANYITVTGTLTAGTKIANITAVNEVDGGVSATALFESNLSKADDATATKTLSFGDTFTSVTDTGVSGHKITNLVTSYTLPTETDPTVPDWAKASTKPNYTADEVGAMSATDPVGTGSLSINRKAGTTVGAKSVAIGHNNTASSSYSFAEGGITTASGPFSHAEGYSSTASSTASHAEGASTVASNLACHAEGNNTQATGVYSHSEGNYTIAAGEASHVQGKYNVEDTENKYAHIVGNGIDGARKNAHTIDWDGNAWFSGGLKVGGTGQDDAAALTVAPNYYIDVDFSLIVSVGETSTCTPSRTFEEILIAYNAGYNLFVRDLNTYGSGDIYTLSYVFPNLDSGEITGFLFSRCVVMGYGYTNISTVYIGSNSSDAMLTYDQGMFVPAPSSSDAGKVLTVADDGTVYWA